MKRTETTIRQTGPGTWVKTTRRRPGTVAWVFFIVFTVGVSAAFPILGVIIGVVVLLAAIGKFVEWRNGRQS